MELCVEKRNMSAIFPNATRVKEQFEVCELVPRLARLWCIMGWHGICLNLAKRSGMNGITTFEVEIVQLLQIL